MRAGPAIVVAAAATTAAAGIGALLAAPAAPLAFPEIAVPAAVGIAVAVLGGWVAARAGAGRVGALLVAIGAANAFGALVDALATAAAVDDAADGVALRAAVATRTLDWAVVMVAAGALAVVFPTGRARDRLGRAALAAFAVGGGVAAAAHLLARRPNEGVLADVPGPVGIPDDVAAAGGALGTALLLAGLVGAAAALVRRYRAARGIERLQLRWLAWSIGTVPLTVTACVAAWAITGRFVEAVVAPAYTLAVLLPPTAVALAITRHRLYAIDRVVNRTAVYALVSIALGVTFLAAEAAIGTVAGSGSALAASLATLAAAALFTPVRRRAQALVDRRLAGERLRAVARLRRFEDDVREGRAAPEEVASALREALADPGARLRCRLPSTGALVEVDAPRAGADGVRACTPVVFEGQEAGLLEHDAALVERPQTLAAVLAAAALPVELARLRLDLRAQLDEVEASRRRLVRAAYAERLRIERDLHDGAQQRLVSLGIALRRMERSLPPGARVLQPALAGAVDEIGAAIADLRTIAAGIRPTRLDDGLAAALADLARGVDVPVALDVQVDALPAEVEEAAYFVACEAVVNAVKHARPGRLEVQAAQVDGELLLSIADDGVGGARPGGGGSGLVGIADRVHAHGGRIAITSPIGSGTRVEVALPCGS